LNVNVVGPLATKAFAILFEKHGALIVLVDDVLHCVITLGREEISGPQHLWHDIVHANQFSLGGAVGVDFLSS
jgi:hypothetical protein